MKLRYFFVCILLVAIFACLGLPMQAALAESTPVLLLSGNTEGDEIVVTATLKNNEGIFAMKLELEYDRDLLTFTGYQEGEALSKLDLISTQNLDAEDYIFTWLGNGKENDASNGKLLTLHFAVKENASGQAYVKFSYTRNQDINYLEGGELVTRNLIPYTLRIDLSSGEATAIASETTNTATVSKEKETNTGLIVGLAVGGSAVIALVVLVPWFVVRKKRV